MLVNAGQSLKTMIKGPRLPSFTVCMLGTLATLQTSHSSFKCTNEKATLITVNLQMRKTMKLTFMASTTELQPIYCSIIYGVYFPATNSNHQHTNCLLRESWPNAVRLLLKTQFLMGMKVYAFNPSIQ